MTGLTTPRDGQLALASIRGIEVGHWDPRRRTDTWGRPVRRARPVRNFGDLLGPLIVERLARRWSLPIAPAPRRLLTVGSILHFGRIGDVVWGSGLNPKAELPEFVAEGLDLRAVRGPRTRDLLDPAAVVGGDPALLLGALRPDLLVPADRRRGVVIVPNLNELTSVRDRAGVVNPRWPLRRVLRRIAGAELVVGSSLHGVIVAEALGVPARAVSSEAEQPFKYEDHYLATGRDPDSVIAGSLGEAIAMGGAPAPRWDPRPLLEAFPLDLWSEERAAPRSKDIAELAGAWNRISESPPNGGGPLVPPQVTSKV